MESIKELRKICQDPSDTRGKFNSCLDVIVRKFSIYFTRLLLYINIKPDHVTILMGLWGFIVGFLFSLGTYGYMLTGAIVLQFLPLLDCIDGELARCKKLSSLNGVFLDLVSHLTHTAIPLVGLTIGLYKVNPNINIVILGLSASVFSVFCLTIQPLKYHVIIKKLIKYAKETGSIKSRKIDLERIKEPLKKKSLFSLVYNKGIIRLYDIHMIYIFLIAAIFNKLQWVLFFYGLTFPLIWLAKLIHEYRTGYKPYEYLFEPYKK